MSRIIDRLFKKISDSIPGLKSKLVQAGIGENPEEFLQKISVASMYFLAFFIIFLLVMFLVSEKLFIFMFFLSLIVYAFLVFYLFKIPDLAIIKKQRGIDREISFAGRFLSIELKSGVPLYNAMRNLAANYKYAGKPFSEIITRVDLGTPMEEAIEDAIQSTPSRYLRKILWQVLNSLRTGTDIMRSLNTVVEQIVKQQTIEIKRYGKKLNPMAMFYMMVAIVFPTLGTVMLIVISGFVSIQVGLFSLLLISVLLGFIQFMFLATIKSSRPEIDI